MTAVSPFVCFLGILFILMVVASIGGITLEPYRPYTNYTFVPRWIKEDGCDGVPEWTGPNGPVRKAPKDEFNQHIPINGSESYEVLGRPSFADRAYSFVTYISEGFTSEFESSSGAFATIPTPQDKDASLLTETAGKGGDPKMSSQVPGNPLVNFPPNKPSPVDFGNRSNYMLLSDELEPIDSGISCVNSRSCFATDFDRLVEKTGNYRQFTNNYKRGYPDSCSSPYQELVLSFYKDDGMQIDAPKNCI